MSLKAVLRIVDPLEVRRFALDAVLALVWAWMPFALLGCGDDPVSPEKSPPLVGEGDPTMGSLTETIYDGDQPPAGPFGRIYYSDLTYLGAIRSPDSGDYAYDTGLIAYVPTRNTFVVVGRGQKWSELSIPLPVVSPNKDPDDLNVATAIMPPSSIWKWLSPFVGLAETMGGITWFEGRIWCGSFEYYNPARRDNLGITCVDDNFGDPRGGWRVGPSGVGHPIEDLFHANKTHEYVMVIPEAWSARYAPGKRLAGGRHRTAGSLGGGNGPALYAFEADYTAPMGADLGGVPLMAFPFQDDMGADYLWRGYTAQDSYQAIWVESGDRQTVIIGSSKGLGPTYYGVGQGCRTDKGYHSEPYEPRLYFIDVNDLGAVAQGRMGVSDVRPYDMVSPQEVWRHPDDPGSDPTCKVNWFSDFAYDDQTGRLFALQTEAYRVEFSNRLIIHVWQVN